MTTQSEPTGGGDLIVCDSCGAKLDRYGCEIFDVPHCMNQPKPTGEWTAGHDGMGKWGVYHGEETKKGWPGKGRLLVDGLSESQAKSIEQTHNAALASEREKVQPLVDALKNVRKDNDELWTDVTTEWRAKLHHQIRTIIDAALAKVKK